MYYLKDSHGVLSIYIYWVHILETTDAHKLPGDMFLMYFLFSVKLITKNALGDGIYMC